MKDLLELSAAKLQQVLVVKRQIELLESRLAALVVSALPSPVAALGQKNGK